MPIDPVTAGASRLTEATVLRSEPTNAVAGQLEPLEGGNAVPAFGDVLSSFVKHVDAAQQKSDQMVQSLALGEPVDVHQVMIALNEASNAMQLALQVRTKVLDAYQEVMRTQV